MFQDLTQEKFEWDHPSVGLEAINELQQVAVMESHMEAITGAHALCVLTEWDAFKAYDYREIFDAMVKPAFVFDGRNILDHDKLREIGFIVYGIGKPLDAFVRRT